MVILGLILFILVPKIYCDQCIGEGLVRDPEDCQKFLYCSSGKVLSSYKCGDNTYFNSKTKVCDWRYNVECQDKVTTEKDNFSTPISTLSTSSSSSSYSSTTQKLSSSTNSITTTSSTTTNKWDGEWHPPIGPTTPAEPDPEEGFKDTEYKIVCYFTNWAWYRPGDGKFIPEDMNPKHCTHINYAFSVLDFSNLLIKVHDSWADLDNQFFKRVTDLKKTNPRLKVLLALGGWNDSAGDKYSRLVNNPQSRKRFIDHAIIFLKKFGFDGLDLDWEYPTCWQTDCKKGPRSDKKAFGEFTSELREAFNKENFLLTAAVSASKDVVDYAYDVPVLASNLDYISLMAYDFHGSWEKFASHHSPIYSRPMSASFDPLDKYFNVNYSVNYWIKEGMLASKIILGIPFYGRSFQLESDPNKSPTHGFGEKAPSGGTPGPYSREKGYLAYYEICDNLNNGWKKFHDESSSVPFAISGNQWVGYDDVDQIEAKSNYIIEYKLGGAMIWAIDLDDFRGKCCGVKYPLLKTLNYKLRGVNSFRDIQCA